MSLFLEMEKRDESCHSLRSTLPDTCSGIGKEVGFVFPLSFPLRCNTFPVSLLPQHLLCVIWYLEWTLQETEWMTRFFFLNYFLTFE